jgi:hypothetical protein
MVSWPVLTDSPGDPDQGTVINHAWEAAVKTSIEDQVHNTTYPTIKPKHIIGEVEDIKAAKAAGSWTDLKDAMDGVIDFTDGSLIVPGSVIDTSDLQAALVGRNLVMNGNFLIWPHADRASYWATHSQASRSTVESKVGPSSMEITRSGADVYISQDILNPLSLMNNYFRNRKIGYGFWCKANSANTAKINIYDGVSYFAAPFHSGSGAWEWLSGTCTLSAGATRLTLQIGVVNNNDTVHYDGMTLWESDVAPDRWVPVEMQYGSIYFPFPGALSTGDHQGSFVFSRHAIVKDIQAGTGVPHDGTPVSPSGGPITIDAEQWDGAAWQSMFTAPKDIVASGGSWGSVQPDGTFKYRCFEGATGAIAALDRSIVHLNIDAVNNAEGFWFAIRVAQFVNPLEEFLDHNDFGGA